MLEKRNFTLDIYKIILSIFVVCIHFPPLFKKGDLLSLDFGSSGIPMIAVPSFFIINGYYISRCLYDKAKFRKNIFRLIIMHIIWSIIYLPLYYEIAPLKYIICFLIVGYYHLWFLPALIAGLCLLRFINKATQSTATTMLICFVIYLLSKLTNSFPVEIKILTFIIDFLSNISTGLFFLSTGLFVREKVKIDQLNKSCLVSLCVLFLTGFVILINSAVILGFPVVAKAIALSLLAVSLFITILRFSIYKESKGYIKYLSHMSAAIYFSHLYLAIRYYPFFEAEYNIKQLPLFLFITIIISCVLIFINKRIKYLL